MEYHVRYNHPLAAPTAIEDEILKIDPAAIVHIDAAEGFVRISSWFELIDLVNMLAASGNPIDPLQIVQLPSTCCGGCT
ncbi:MAG: hypothetical protein JSS44_02540 [Proteobacteria bacterium]|nr:hypothetical protein [Pseudomonadota bacterium]MBS0462245.1 hypothetical protein [Pseudomonadota bacterium]MBS0465353.1 hypothetical protein [Pseudomonadota bacterium]